MLFDVMPGVESRVRYVDYIYERGTEVFELARKNELEGIVAKWVAARTSMANPQAGSRSRTRGIRKWKGDTSCSKRDDHDRKVRAVVCVRLRSCSPKNRLLNHPPARQPFRLGLLGHLTYVSTVPYDFAPMELAAVVDPELRPRWHHPRAASAVLLPFRSTHEECSGMCSGFRGFAKPTLMGVAFSPGPL